MRIKVDENIGGSGVTILRQDGHDVIEAARKSARTGKVARLEDVEW